MNAETILSPPPNYKPKRCCECGKRPFFQVGDDGPGWKCECGAFAAATPTMEVNGRPAHRETHDLRVEALGLFNALVEDIHRSIGGPPYKARSRAYNMGSAILKKPLSFRYLSADQARKLIRVWSVG